MTTSAAATPPAAAGNTVAVVGCGDVGSVLAAELAAAGHRVIGVRRRAVELPQPIETVRADVTVSRSLEVLPDGLDLVVYLVAADRRDPEAYRAAYVDGVANVLAAAAARAAPSCRFVFASSTAVYGQTGGEWVDEDSPTEPPDFRGALLLEGEALVHAAPPRGVVVRLAGIYGPGRTRLIDAVRAGRASASPNRPEYTNRIHRDDCAGAIAHVAGLPEPDGVYLGVDDRPAPRDEVLGWLAAELDAPAEPVDADDGPSEDRRSNKRCSNARLRASGYELRFPTYVEGYRAVLAGTSRPPDSSKE
jgi:nucleoside-diphosphate-sugar epimerase